LFPQKKLARSIVVYTEFGQQYRFTVWKFNSCNLSTSYSN